MIDEALSVILDEPIRGSTDLTPFIGDKLDFGLIAPGGYAGCEFDLAREIDAREFEENSDIFIYDETGEQVGGGVIRNPGRSVSARGSVWRVSADGKGPAHFQEKKIPYMVIDTRTDAWVVGAKSNQRIQWQQQDLPGTAEKAGWTMVISPGTLSNNAFARLNFYDMEQYAKAAGDFRTEIGGYAWRHIEGNDNDVNNFMETILASWDGTDAETITRIGFDADTENIRRREITTDWSTGGIGVGNNMPALRLTHKYERDTTAAVGGDDDWAHVRDLRVSALRVDRNGNPITAAGTYASDPASDYVLAHEAIIDCWARFCPDIDVPNARIDETATFQHRDLVWPDGVTPYDVLEKLLEHDPAFTWAVWERLPSGLYRAEWRQLDTDVRYEIMADEFTQTGVQAKRFGQVFVATESDSGYYRVLQFGDEEDLPTETVRFSGKLDDTDFNEAASALGNTTLEHSSLDSSSGKATIARKVYDHHLNKWVKPYKMLPGYLCRVPGVRSRDAFLNAGQADGAAVFRIVTNDYSAASRTSQLELNAYTFDEQRAIAELVNS